MIAAILAIHIVGRVAPDTKGQSTLTLVPDDHIASPALKVISGVCNVICGLKAHSAVVTEQAVTRVNYCMTDCYQRSS